MYEVCEISSGGDPKKYEDALRKKLDKYYDGRLELDKTLMLESTAHYGFARIGGTGPVIYGPFCVILKPTVMTPFATVFAGDSITTVFDKEGKRGIAEKKILERFAVVEDVVKLATQWHEDYVRSSRYGIKIQDLVREAEGKSLMMECHILGPVLLKDVVEIVIQEEPYKNFWSSVHRWEKAGCPISPNTIAFDEADSFVQLVELCEQNGIPLNQI